MNHRMLLRVVVVLLLAALAGPGLALTSAQSQGTAGTAPYLGGPEHSGRQPGPGPTGEPVVSWRFQTGDAIRSSPVMANGIVYVGSNDRFLYALEAATGEELWRFETGGGILSTPAVTDDTVFFGSNDRFVYALDSVTGEQKWRFETNARMTTAPTVVEDTIYFGGNDQVLYAVAVETGLERWHTVLPERHLTSPTYVDGVLFVGSSGQPPLGGLEGGGSDSTIGRLFAVDTETGELIWALPQPEEEEATQATAVEIDTNDAEGDGGDGEDGSSDAGGTEQAGAIGEGVPTTTEDSVVSFAGGRPLKAAYFTSSPSVVDDVVYSASIIITDDSRIGGILTASDAATGAEQWTWYFRTLQQVDTTPVVGNGVVYVGNREGFLYAVDAETATQLWGFQTEDQVMATPALAGDTLYVASYNGVLFALDAETGLTRWQFATDGPIWNAPAVVDGLVLVASDDGTLYALGDG